MNARNADTFDHHRGPSPLLQPTRLWRTILFVSINVMGFAVVSAFWQYLSTGKWLNFDAFFRNLFIPMGAVFIQPLGIFAHPWMVPVYGLLLGVTILVPITVSVLYRLRVAVIFLVMLAFVAQLPLLALAVVTGCVMTGHTPFRSNMPMAAALLGMLPAIIYVVVLGCPTLAGTTDRDYWATVEPARRWVLYGPYLLALLSVIIGSAVVLAMAKVTNFRPGAVWPVLLVLSAAPMVAFYVRVGPAELQYSLIVNRTAPGDMILPEMPLGQWLRDHPDTVGLTTTLLGSAARRDLLAKRDALTTRCELFLADHNRHARVPEVMWILAQSRSMQLDEVVYRNDVIRGTCAFVLPAARPTWQSLLDTYPRSDQAALARLRLAQLALRDESIPPPDRLELANQLLRQAREDLEDILAAQPDSRGDAASPAIFTKPRARPQQSYYYRALHDVRKLQRLIELNDLEDDPDGVELLTTLLNIDPAQPDAGELYQQLARDHMDVALGDNIELAAALAQQDRQERAKKLLPLANIHGLPTDTTVEAAFELALLQVEGIEQIEGVLAEEVYLKAIIAAPANPWQDQAANRLKLLQIAREISP